MTDFYPSMKDPEISPPSSEVSLPSEGELSPHRQINGETLLPQEYRVVIYGSVMSGAVGLVNTIEGWLDANGLQDNLAVNMTRDVRYIQPAFYGQIGRRRPQPVEHPKQLESVSPPSSHIEPKHLSTRALMRVRDLFSKKTKVVEHAPVVLEPATNPTPRPDTRPIGAIIFQEMRQYDERIGGMSLDTPVEVIQQLCEDNHVPYVIVEKRGTSDDIVSALNTLAGINNPAITQ